MYTVFIVSGDGIGLHKDIVCVCAVFYVPQSLCINEDVKRLKSLTLINDRCLEMQRNKKKSMHNKNYVLVYRLCTYMYMYTCMYITLYGFYHFNAAGCHL